MMNKIKHTTDLYNEYPKQFIKNSISCDDGWLDIISEMCAAIQIYLDYDGRDDLEQVKFIEIKNRFGCLDISYTGGDEVTEHIIKYCERLSWKICSVCGGADATLFCSTKWRNWGYTKTLCEHHAIKLFYYRLS